jgi:hypothetical protein
MIMSQFSENSLWNSRVTKIGVCAVIVEEGNDSPGELQSAVEHDGEGPPVIILAYGDDLSKGSVLKYLLISNISSSSVVTSAARSVTGRVVGLVVVRSVVRWAMGNNSTEEVGFETLHRELFWSTVWGEGWNTEL